MGTIPPPVFAAESRDRGDQSVPNMTVAQSRVRNPISLKERSVPFHPEPNSMPGLDVGVRLAAVLVLVGSTLWLGPWKDQLGTDDKIVASHVSVMKESIQNAVVESAHTHYRQLVTPQPRRKLDPQSLCNVLAGNETSAVWSESWLFPGEWECTAEVGRGASAGPSDTNPLFAMARGRDPETIDFVRVKLSLPEGGAGAAQVELLQEIAFSVMSATGHRLTPALESSLRALRPIRLSVEGIEVVFASEKTFPGRYNLIFRLGS